MLDRDGFRPNVGIVLANRQGQVLWARRVGGHDAWQFPQGGVDEGESLKDALHRELEEETGLQPDHVRVLAQTQSWLRYRIPRKFRRYNSDPDFRGQKQHWFLLELQGPDEAIAVDAGDKPEFDGWRWVSYWYPVGQVVDFKRGVYQRALAELAPYLPLPEGERAPGQPPRKAYIDNSDRPVERSNKRSSRNPGRGRANRSNRSSNSNRTRGANRRSRPAKGFQS